MDFKNYILECLEKYCNFDDLSSGSFYNQIVFPLEENGCFNKVWAYDSGASKGVLIFKDFDYVVKIPFAGYPSSTDAHWESERGGWHWSKSSYSTDKGFKYVEEEEEFFNFSGAYLPLTREDRRMSDSDWDYCRVEEIRYLDAEGEGLAKCFAKTFLLGFANDFYPIYLQEKCFMLSDKEVSENDSENMRTSESYQSVQRIQKQQHFYLNEMWMVDFYIYYGEDYLIKLINFIDSHNITDLHDGNIGYLNGRPCLIDYSSYCD